MYGVRKFLALIVATACPVAGLAQLEKPDSVSIVPADTLPSYLRPLDGDYIVAPAAVAPSWNYDASYLSGVASLQPDWQMKMSVDRIVSGVADIAKWNDGGVSAYGSAMSLPGMMGVERGGISINQSFGRLTLTASATVAKYGYFRGLQTAYGFSGSASYRFSDKWSMTLFGSYFTGVNPLYPGMAGYMDVPNFGGYVSYDINEHWGVNVGAQATRSLVTNRWEAQPIVEPYYKINDKTAIGVDVGGILYQLVKDYNNRKNNGGCPVMAPPRPGPPPVAPHPGKY